MHLRLNKLIIEILRELKTKPLSLLATILKFMAAMVQVRQPQQQHYSGYCLIKD